MDIKSNCEVSVVEQIEKWLEQVVIGLNLCPFAAKPQRNNQIKIAVSEAISEESLLEDILVELNLLQAIPETEVETTLVVVPNMLSSFDDYNLFIDWVDALLKQQQLEGVIQVATFHPDYCFAGNQPEDMDNLTNRSPYPIFHLIREDSLEKALKHYPNPEAIPEANIETVNGLPQEKVDQLFPHLKGTKLK